VAADGQPVKFPRFVPVMALAGALAAPLGARAIIGGFGAWAAFCDEPRKCFAISQPDERSSHPFLSVAVIGRGPKVVAHVGRRVRDASIRIGDMRFDLAVAGEDAIADSATSRRIVAAMRAGDALTVSGRSTKGGGFRHHYQLTGAPSAIDAAALASRR
jgi:hypothetical protein